MPAASKSQRRLMGMVYSYQKGELDTKNMPKKLVAKIKEIAKNTDREKIKDFATTKEDNLPNKVKNENVTLNSVPGMGAVRLPENPGSIEDFSSQEAGSGDIPISKKKKKKFKFIKTLKDFLNKKSNI